MIPKNLIAKTVKLCVCLVTLLIIVSGGVKSPENNDIVLLEGRYLIKSSGDFNKELKGYINFETSKEKSANGKNFSTLKLDLKNEDKSPKHSLEFLISKQNQDKHIPVVGSYSIVKDIDGFLNYFDGVFGFANIRDLGEAPLFAHKGKITIDHFDDNCLSGLLTVNLQNSGGKRIYLTGSFVATKRN